VPKNSKHVVPGAAQVVDVVVVQVPFTQVVVCDWHTASAITTVTSQREAIAAITRFVFVI
jgi:hypothetical protein